MNETLEQEIASLENELQEKKTMLEQEQSEPIKETQEKEILHDVVGGQIQQQSQAQSDDQTVVPELPLDNSSGMDDHVQSLVAIAFNQSLKHAITQAVKTNNAALIDAFHDALVDDLYDELVARKKVEQPK
ncbi:MAG: hypothetical protein AAB479_00570 [Patescibacteria group bacterium]